MATQNQFDVTLADGETVRVQTTLEDRLAFEQALRKNKGWGKLEDNSLKLHPYLAWHALHRRGETELTWVQFTTGETAAIGVEPAEDDEPADLDAEDLEVEGVGKDTPPAPSTTSASAWPATTAAPHGDGATSPAHA